MKDQKEKDMNIDRINLETGQLDSVITLEEALSKLVPDWYVDREVAARTLQDGQPIRTIAFEYRKHE